jgi:hypothetical protein
MNILSLGCTNAVHSHLIPLFVLHQRYFRRMQNVSSFFLLPEQLHDQYKRFGINVIQTDFAVFNGDHLDEALRLIDPTQKLRTIYDEYRTRIQYAFDVTAPDIIVEDNEVFSTLLAEKNGIPRISIFRTGLFRSIDKEKRNPSHMHSMEKTSAGRGFDASMILKPKKRLSQLQRNHLKYTYLKDDVDYFMNYLAPKTKLIPGIRSIEKLPEDIENKKSFFYTGPLLVEDNPSLKLQQEVKQFFASNKSRKKVFITTGLVDRDNVDVMIIYLLQKGYAVISTRKVSCAAQFNSQFLSNGFISLNFVCSEVDLVIHQCGSGTYHYPLLHEKPAITIGTQCYDREDVALRLEELHLSKHVPSPKDDEHYMDVFANHLGAFENGDLCDHAQIKKMKSEIYNTMLEFDMEKVIDYTLSC